MFLASETCFGCKSDHYLLSQHVEFEINIHNFISFVSSFNVSSIDLVNVVGAIIFVRSAKNDTRGSIHKIPTSRNVSSGYDVCAL